MSFRRAARTDSNHQQIVKEFKRLGWSVLDVSQLKKCCDLFVSKDFYTVAVEVKDGAKPPSARKLTAGEIDFRDKWSGAYMLVQSIDDVNMLNETQKKVTIE